MIHSSLGGGWLVLGAADFIGVFRCLSACVLALLALGTASAVTLEVPEVIQRSSGLVPEAVTVVEPHESDARHEVTVAYLGFPITPLLDRWFAKRWDETGIELVFDTRDGYRSTISAERFRRERAFLAFARVDGRPFTVDNPEQNQLGVPLGPYYLVWDNRALPDRHSRGTEGWAYQIESVDLRDRADEDRRLLLGLDDTVTRAGLADTRKYCLTCHVLRGVGGHKHPVDLAELSCRRSDAALSSWLLDPGTTKPGTTMPALNRGLPETERTGIATRIVGYLASFRTATGACTTEH